MPAPSEVKSAARVLELLELFDQLQTPLTLREIVERTGYPQSSTAALLATLIQRGYVMHDRSSAEYAPTALVAHLGRWVGGDGISTHPLIRRTVAWLHRQTGETAIAAVQLGTYVRYEIVSQDARPKVVMTEPGVLRPICTSASGLALLSRLDDATVRALVRRAQRERRGITVPVRWPQVRQQLEWARRYGFAVSRGGVFAGTGMVAMPLPLPVNGQDVALGVGGPVPRLDAQLSHIVEALRHAMDMVFRPALQGSQPMPANKA